jgi:hypothetical protein
MNLIFDNSEFEKSHPLNVQLQLIIRQQTLTNESKRKQIFPNRIPLKCTYTFVLLK